MADAHALLEDGFREGLARLTDSYRLKPMLDELSEEEAIAYGGEGARSALAPLIWRAVAGETLETERVRSLLRLSRQALAQRVERGTVLGLPGQRTTHYPTWQFDGTGIRSVVTRILAAFRAELGDDVDPLLITSWAGTSQAELHDQTPASWITSGGEDEPVVKAAKRAAGALAR